MTINKSEKGFTIIEVVVVLAIAGLIFGIVFWALPNLQRSNRDSTRRVVVANIMANLDQFASNSNGNYPASQTAFQDFLGDYFASGVNDPLAGSFDGSNPATSIEFVNNTSDDVTSYNSGNPGVLLYGVSTQCDDNNPGTIVGGAGQRAISVSITLEQGGGYCLDNS